MSAILALTGSVDFGHPCPFRLVMHLSHECTRNGPSDKVQGGRYSGSIRQGAGEDGIAGIIELWTGPTHTGSCEIWC